MTNDQEKGELTMKPRKKPVRSRFQFPSYDFGVARQITEKVEFEGAGHLSEQTLAISLHASAKSSGFRLKTLAARQFQLLTKEGNMLTTTPLAKAILKPTSEDEKKRKMVESFMAIPLFNAVATRFSGQPLPQSQALRNILEREFGVEGNRVSEAERILIDSARETSLLRQSGDKTYLVTEIIPTAQPPTPPGMPQELGIPPSGGTTQPPGGLLTVSEQDLAEFNDEEFQDIWQALGKIVRARGKRQSPQEKQITNTEVEEEKE
jgi:hypothetical protein